MLIRAPKTITKGQIAFVVILGFGAGYYVWRPIFEKLQKDKTKIPNQSPIIDNKEAK